MKRRELVRPLGGAATGWSLAARGHTPNPFAGHVPIRGKTAREFILPIGLSLALVVLTSLMLAQIHSDLTALEIWHDPEDLALAYLLPTIFIAVFFGSTLRSSRRSQAESPLPTLSIPPNSVFCSITLRTLPSSASSSCWG